MVRPLRLWEEGGHARRRLAAIWVAGRKRESLHHIAVKWSGSYPNLVSNGRILILLSSGCASLPADLVLFCVRPSGSRWPRPGPIPGRTIPQAKTHRHQRVSGS